MELSLPADLYVLRVMSDGRTTNPVRVRHRIATEHADELADEWQKEPWTREYVSHVMARLKDRELLERVPPDNSGLYRITRLGHAALHEYRTHNQTTYSFRELLETADSLPEEPDPVPDDEQFTKPD